MVRVNESHHYDIYVDFCPVCGKTETTRVRVKGKRRGKNNAWIISETYDYCQEL